MSRTPPSMGFRVRRAVGPDLDSWRSLRVLLWPDSSRRQLTEEMGAYLRAGGRAAAFVAERSDGRLVGFVEVSVRPYNWPALQPGWGFLEGLFVLPEVRHRGIATALVRTAERWARERGARRIGSDTDPHNRASRATHRALGYAEVERLVVFEKSLK